MDNNTLKYVYLLFIYCKYTSIITLVDIIIKIVSYNENTSYILLHCSNNFTIREYPIYIYKTNS